MCRLFAVTGTKPGAAMRRVLFDYLALASVSDDNQVYGSGITDGHKTVKSGRSYLEVDSLAWMTKLDAAYSWSGHLRKPSKGVDGAASNASHPFCFPKSGLVGSHNGYVAGMLPSAPAADEPFVDSYYALKALSKTLEDHKLSSWEIDNWISAFGAYSEFCFMLHHEESLWVVRGNRPMYRATLGDGHVFATSWLALSKTMTYTSLWPDYFQWGKRIIEVPEFTAIRIPRGGEFTTHHLKKRPKAPPPITDVTATIENDSEGWMPFGGK